MLGDLIDWCIVGGESGAKARPCNLEWIASVKNQAVRHGIPCFVKQVGARPITPVTGKPWRISDPKGGEPAEWPKHLRFRQWPKKFGRLKAAAR